MDVTEATKNFPRRSITLLDDLMKGRLDIDQSQKKCFEWLIEPVCWNNSFPKDFPRRSDNVERYFLQSRKERHTLTGSYYRDNPDILRYINEISSIFHENRERCEQLKDFISYASEEEEPKIRQRISIFEMRIAQQGAMCGYLKYIERRWDETD